MVAPRFHVTPAGAVSSRGDEAAELAAASGLNLSEEQRLVLHGGLGVRGDGRPAAFEVATVQPRRTGKSKTLEALILLALKDGKTVAYTSVRVDSAQEVFLDLVELVELSPVLSPLLEKVSYANGKEAVRLSNGGRCVFGTRSSRTGRGFGLDLLVLDEAMILAEQAHNALIPATSAQASPPQVWYAGTAVDESDNEHGVVLSRIRARALSGEAKSLSYTEWSVDLRDDDGNELRPEQVTEEMVTEEMLRDSQPGWGSWIRPEQMEVEREAMGWRGWLNERCGIGAWSDTSGEAEAPITGEEWNELCDPASKRVGPLLVAFDVGRDRQSALVACGRRSDDLLHPELIRFAPRTAWLREQIIDMNERYDLRVVCDDYGGNRAVAAALEEAGVRVDRLSGAETVAACSKLLDLTAEKAYRHIGQPELLAALRGAKARTVGEAWAWGRKDSSGDASVVIALTLALAKGSELPKGDDPDWKIH